MIVPIIIGVALVKLLQYHRYTDIFVVHFNDGRNPSETLAIHFSTTSKLHVCISLDTL